MPDKPTTTYSQQGGRSVRGYQGSQAGRAFESTAEVEAKKLRDLFDNEMGWSGLGGASKKPKASEYETRFAEWRKKRAAKAGQAAAVK